MKLLLIMTPTSPNVEFIIFNEVDYFFIFSVPYSFWEKRQKLCILPI